MERPVMERTVLERPVMEREPFAVSSLNENAL